MHNIRYYNMLYCVACLIISLNTHVVNAHRILRIVSVDIFLTRFGWHGWALHHLSPKSDSRAQECYVLNVVNGDVSLSAVSNHLWKLHRCRGEWSWWLDVGFQAAIPVMFWGAGWAWWGVALALGVDRFGLFGIVWVFSTLIWVFCFCASVVGWTILTNFRVVSTTVLIIVVLASLRLSICFPRWSVCGFKRTSLSTTAFCHLTLRVGSLGKTWQSSCWLVPTPSSSHAQALGVLRTKVCMGLGLIGIHS